MRAHVRYFVPNAFRPACFKVAAFCCLGLPIFLILSSSGALNLQTGTIQPSLNTSTLVDHPTPSHRRLCIPCHSPPATTRCRDHPETSAPQNANSSASWPPLLLLAGLISRNGLHRNVYVRTPTMRDVVARGFRLSDFELHCLCFLSHLSTFFASAAFVYLGGISGTFLSGDRFD